MNWLVFIAIVLAIYIIHKFYRDSKEEKRNNIASGGMVHLFPEFVAFFERNGYEFVKDTGSVLVYRLPVDKNPYIRFLYICVQKKFTNIAYGYALTNDNKRINGVNIEFKQVTSQEQIDMIIRKVIGPLKLKKLI